MNAPGSVNTQSGSGKTGLGKGTAKSSGGSNQGKVGGQTPRYSAHPRTRGQ